MAGPERVAAVAPKFVELEVLDNQNQIRFVQRALFEGEHYELGILFAEEKRADDVAI